jgi:hypothetical protein
MHKNAALLVSVPAWSARDRSALPQAVLGVKILEKVERASRAAT